MKNLIASFALLLLATQACAFSKEWPGAAGNGVSGSCSGCTPGTVTPAASLPTNVFEVPLTGPGGRTVIYRMRYPTETTSATIPAINLNLMRLTAIDSNNGYDYLVCAGVVRDGELASNIDLSACAASAVTGSFSASQWDVVQTTSGAITPHDTTGSDCTLPNCSGAELWIQVNFVINGFLCPSCTTDTIGIMDVTPNFVQ